MEGRGLGGGALPPTNGGAVIGVGYKSFIDHETSIIQFLDGIGVLRGNVVLELDIKLSSLCGCENTIAEDASRSPIHLEGELFPILGSTCNLTSHVRRQLDDGNLLSEEFPEEVSEIRHI